VRRVIGRALGVVVPLLMLLAPRTARAQDAFEIQVYDAETAPPGDTGFELHVNSALVGVTTLSPEGELPSQRVTHLTLEPHVGLLPWCEAGGYLQAAIRPDGTFDYAGVKLRFKMRVPRRLHNLIGLALNLELSSLPRTYEATQLGSELRPVIDLEWRRLYASVNPIIGIDFESTLAGHPQLEPAATILIRILPQWTAGLEYYGAYGPIDHPFPAASQIHRLFVVTNVEHKWFAFHIGAGYGFTAGDKWIVKSILSFDLASPH
jgi:hypothetical protein